MPQPPSDHELLRDYALHRSQSAFAELASRYVDFVWSAARRQVRDEHLAEDVTQAVFLLLARKAAKLDPTKVSLAGWLHTTTHYAANNARRGEARRQSRERKAGEAMRQETSKPDALKFEDIEPAIDGALRRLAARDRDAVIMRFLRQMSLREVGAALGVSEDAAKVRVARALAKLREMLGVTAPSSALAAVLATETVRAAPAGLAPSVVAASCGTTAATVGAVNIMKGVCLAMRYAKLKLAAAFTAAALSGGAAAGYVIGNLTTARPAAQPAAATQPAAEDDDADAFVHADGASPVAALRVLMHRVRDGTDQGEGWIATTVDERRCGEAISDMTHQAERLRAATERSYGDALSPTMPVNLPRPEQLDNASVAYTTDDRAMAHVIGSDRKTLTPMRRDGDAWKLSVYDLVTMTLKTGAEEELADDCERVSRALERLTDLVESGDLATIEEARAAMTEALSKR
jgi:RNA polymerase sigma factor (sigma-70 family)